MVKCARGIVCTLCVEALESLAFLQWLLKIQITMKLLSWNTGDRMEYYNRRILQRNVHYAIQSVDLMC